jgi:imidazolonepropionase-like amidohydrolase
MVVLDADPLEEIQNLRKIHLVVQGGKTYEPDGLFEQARSQAKKKP